MGERASHQRRPAHTLAEALASADLLSAVSPGILL